MKRLIDNASIPPTYFFLEKIASVVSQLNESSETVGFDQIPAITVTINMFPTNTSSLAQGNIVVQLQHLVYKIFIFLRAPFLYWFQNDTSSLQLLKLPFTRQSSFTNSLTLSLVQLFPKFSFLFYLPNTFLPQLF